MKPIIAILTDFGDHDIYIGVMKGVMLAVSPDAALVDLTHHIQPQNVRQAAFALMNAVPHFPQGTVFLAVVDPGVGSTRRPLAARAGPYSFVAPDNGLLSYALADLDPVQAVDLTERFHRDETTSHTFHGRDIFAPAAAHLARGHALESLGPALDGLFHLPPPVLEIDGPVVTGEVLHIDHFGNVISSIGLLQREGEDVLRLRPRFGHLQGEWRFAAGAARVQAGDVTLHGIGRAYHEAPRGELLALVDSNGFLEIGCNHGSAAQRLGLVVGDRIRLQTAPL